MERKEVQRRKDEIRTRKELLEEKRKKHQQIESDIVEQVTLCLKCKNAITSEKVA